MKLGPPYSVDGNDDDDGDDDNGEGGEEEIFFKSCLPLLRTLHFYGPNSPSPIHLSRVARLHPLLEKLGVGESPPLGPKIVGDWTPLSSLKKLTAITTREATDVPIYIGGKFEVAGNHLCCGDKDELSAKGLDELVHLTSLVLENRYFGTRAPQLKQLRDLRILSVVGCYFRGPFPYSWARLNLSEINIALNNFSGTLPDELCSAGKERYKKKLLWIPLGGEVGFADFSTWNYSGRTWSSESFHLTPTWPCLYQDAPDRTYVIPFGCAGCKSCECIPQVQTRVEVDPVALQINRTQYVTKSYCANASGLKKEPNLTMLQQQRSYDDRCWMYAKGAKKPLTNFHKCS